MNKKAIILLSGGLDSVTTLAIAQNLGFEAYALSFYYGQRHKIELEFVLDDDIIAVPLITLIVSPIVVGDTTEHVKLPPLNVIDDDGYTVTIGTEGINVPETCISPHILFSKIFKVQL